MTQDIYVAIATYGPEDDIPCLVALGTTAELAESSLERLIDDSENSDGWIAGGAELHGVAQPDAREPSPWGSLTEQEREDLVSLQMDEIRDDLRSVAIEQLQDLDQESLDALLDAMREDC